MKRYYDDITEAYFWALQDRYDRGLIDCDKFMRLADKLVAWDRVAGERGLPISYGGDRD